MQVSSSQENTQIAIEYGFPPENASTTLEDVQRSLKLEWFLNTRHLSDVIYNLLYSSTKKIREEEREKFDITNELYMKALKLVYQPAEIIIEKVYKLTESPSFSSGISDEIQSCPSDKEIQTDPEPDLIERNEKLQIENKSLTEENKRLTEENKMIQEEKLDMLKILKRTRLDLTALKAANTNVRLLDLEEELSALKAENAKLTEKVNQLETTQTVSESSGSSVNNQTVSESSGSSVNNQTVSKSSVNKRMGTASYKQYTIFRTNSNLPNLQIPLYVDNTEKHNFINLMFNRYKDSRQLNDVNDFLKFSKNNTLFSGIYKVMEEDRSLTQEVLDDLLSGINS